MPNARPLLERYRSLVRLGDFYEAFDADAETIAQVLGLTLTRHGNGPNAALIAGFPYHQLDSYLPKLAVAGFNARVVEQL